MKEPKSQTRVKGRVLVATEIAGVSYKPDDLVELEQEQLFPHRKEVDTSPEAVAYAEALNGRRARRRQLEEELQSGLLE